MGRRNGKLVNFLKAALETQKYINLFYDPMKPDVFELDLPRYKKPMDSKYEIILKDWFELNKRVYKNYSNGKTVLQVAMRKSLYITSLKPICKRLLFRFNTPEESEEKKKQQKEKFDFKEKMPFSVASSKYVSGRDSSPGPSETNDQLQDDGDYDNDIDTLSLFSSNCLIEAINNSPDEDMELNTDQITENWMELEEFCKNIIDGSKDVLDLSELNKTSDQSVCSVGFHQPKITRDNYELPAICFMQFPETQNAWMCISKICIGSLIQYICELVTLTSLTKADPPYQLVSIQENSKLTSYVLIGSTLWEPGRTMKEYIVLSDGKYIAVFYE